MDTDFAAQKHLRNYGNVLIIWASLPKLVVPIELPASCNAINLQYVVAKEPAELNDNRVTARVSTEEQFYFSHVTP